MNFFRFYLHRYTYLPRPRVPYDSVFFFCRHTDTVSTRCINFMIFKYLLMARCSLYLLLAANWRAKKNGVFQHHFACPCNCKWFDKMQARAQVQKKGIKIHIQSMKPFAFCFSTNWIIELRCRRKLECLAVWNLNRRMYGNDFTFIIYRCVIVYPCVNVSLPLHWFFLYERNDRQLWSC